MRSWSGSSADPIGLAGGVNAYAYAGNDPVNATDPSGLCSVWTHRETGAASPRTVCQIDGISITGARIPARAALPFPERAGRYQGSGRCCRGQEEALFRRVAGRTAWLNPGRETAGGAADVAVGFVPIVSTVHDANVLFTGHNAITGETVGAGGRVIAFAGVATPVSGGQIRGVWKITRAATSRVFNGPFGKIWEHASDQTFWSKDTAGHGKSVWKVFREEHDGLHWAADADEYGDYMVGKHKGPVGTFIPWSQLRGTNW